MKNHFEPLTSDPFRLSDFVIVALSVIGVIVILWF